MGSTMLLTQLLLFTGVLIAMGEVVYHINHDMYMKINNSAPVPLGPNFTVCVVFQPSQMISMEAGSTLLWISPITLELEFYVEDSQPHYRPLVTMDSQEGRVGLHPGGQVTKDAWNSLCLSVDALGGAIGERLGFNNSAQVWWSMERL